MFEDNKTNQEIILRDYQKEAIERIRELVKGGKKNIILYSPTGSGKTVIGAVLIKRSQELRKRSMFVCDRNVLVDQTSFVLDGYGLHNHGVIQADHWRSDGAALTQVCSAQTLSRRYMPIYDLAIIDEAHTIYKVMEKELKKRESVIIGLTATPFTKGLNNLYDGIVSVSTTNKLIEEGYLSPIRVFSKSEPNMDGVKEVGGEWEVNEAGERAMTVVGDCVSEYLKHARGRKFIGFGCNVAHCEALVEKFNDAHISTLLYSYRQTDNEKQMIMREFRKPNSEIRGLITVSALSKGTDVPDVSCIILARPLKKSFAEHIQVLGRGMRSYPDKKDCIVLDHAGNIKRFYDKMIDLYEYGVVELGYYGKRKNKKLTERKPMKCPKCYCIHKPAKYCPECGYEYPKRQNKVIHEAGILVERGIEIPQNQIDEVWRGVVGYGREKNWERKKMIAVFLSVTKQLDKEDKRYGKFIPDNEVIEVDTGIRNMIHKSQRAYFFKNKYRRWGSR